VLYIGDHIFGDMLRSRKSSAWRTAMVLQELENEVGVHDRIRPELSRLDDLERQLRHLDAEISDKQLVLRALQRREWSDGNALTDSELEVAKRTVKDTLDRLRSELRASMHEHGRLENILDQTFNPHWGPLFREGHEISKFGEQVEAYACVYTSRVSNFRFYSPNRHFRGPRDRMPHER
jgi:5'-nucleotidase